MPALSVVRIGVPVFFPAGTDPAEIVEDMPGGINKTADFYTLAGITIRDGIWSQTARTISA